MRIHQVPVFFLAALFAGLFTASAVAAQATVTDLDGRPIDLFRSAAATKATVVLFLRTDCPISNRYAPELRRLHGRFAAAGVAFWLAYAGRDVRSAAVRDHVAGFELPGRVLRDPRHALVDRLGATVTPEAAVLDGRGRLAYRGAIDDRYSGFGVERPEPAKRYLEDAVAAVLGGRPVATPVTRAVGCFLEDLR